MCLHLIQGIALPFSDAMHRKQVDLQVLLGLELLAAHITRDILGLHSMNIDNMLLQVRIIRVYLAAFGTLWFTAVIGVVHRVVTSLCLLMEHRHTLDLVLRTGVKHQVQLIALLGALLETLEIVLQFLMHHRELLSVQAVE